MDKNLNVLTSLLDEANLLYKDEKASAYSLKTVIEKYNECRPQDLPDVDSFNDRTDVSSDYASIGVEGFYKLTKIRMELAICLNATAGNPATKIVSDFAEEIAREAKPSAYSLKALIEKYNECKPQDLPDVDSFDDGADVDSDYGSIGVEGFYKLTKIRLELSIYLKSSTGIPAIKVVSEFANEIAHTKGSSAYSLKAIIEKYNKCKPQDLPDVDSFNDRTDVSSDYASIGGEGFYKLTKIRLELDIYLNTIQGIPNEKAVANPIFEIAKELSKDEKTSSYVLKALIEKYNGCELENLSPIPSYNENTDSDGIYIAEDGFAKLETIRINLSNYKK